jgi:hypothetical protein
MTIGEPTFHDCTTGCSDHKRSPRNVIGAASVTGRAVMRAGTKPRPV